MQDLPLHVYQERMTRIKKHMSDAGIDAIVVSSIKRNTVKYLSDFTQPNFLQASGNCLLVVPLNQPPTLIVQAVPFGRKGIEEETWIEDVRLGSTLEAVLDHCTDVLKGLNLQSGQVGLVGREITALIEMYLKNSLPKCTFQDFTDIHDKMRMIKCPEEISLLKEIQVIADTKFKAAMEATKIGATQYEIMAAAEYAGRVLGADHATEDLIGSAPDSSHRLVFTPTFDKVKGTEVILFEAIPFLKGYNVELIGVLVPGEASKEQVALSELVFEAHEAGLKVAKPGVAIAEVYKTALSVVKEAGYDGFTHSLGHGIGLDNGEKPDFGEWALSTTSNEDSPTLEEGMVFSYHANITGVNKPKATFGTVYVITKTGVEALTKITPQALYYL